MLKTLLLSVALIATPSYAVAESKKTFKQQGISSWYGTPFHGRKTASGETFNMHSLTAAHRTLPLGSKVKVTNTSNGKSVILKINDRGPFHGNRVLDVSKAAATQLGMLSKGTSHVSIERLF